MTRYLAHSYVRHIHIYVTQVPPIVILSGPLTDSAASQDVGRTGPVTCTGSSLGCGAIASMPSGSDEFGSFTAMTFACSCAGVDIHYVVRAYQQTIGAADMRCGLTLHASVCSTKLARNLKPLGEYPCCLNFSQRSCFNVQLTCFMKHEEIVQHEERVSILLILIKIYPKLFVIVRVLIHVCPPPPSPPPL